MFIQKYQAKCNQTKSHKCENFSSGFENFMLNFWQIFLKLLFHHLEICFGFCVIVRDFVPDFSLNFYSSFTMLVKFFQISKKEMKKVTKLPKRNCKFSKGTWI